MPPWLSGSYHPRCLPAAALSEQDRVARAGVVRRRLAAASLLTEMSEVGAALCGLGVGGPGPPRL